MRKSDRHYSKIWVEGMRSFLRCIRI
jgi:hypothetical protein